MKQKIGTNATYPDTVLYHRLSPQLYNKIVDFMNKRSYNTRTAAINDLLSVALIVIENLSKIEDPELVSELRAQIHEGGLVNYISSLNPHQLEVLWSLVDTEVKRRTEAFKEKFHVNDGRPKF